MKTHKLGGDKFIEFIFTRDRNEKCNVVELAEHCSANAEAMASNPVEALGIFLGYNSNSTDCDDHILISICGNVRTFHFYC